ncbi:hypothetical protein ACVJGD_007887 [Bradyrhizobium sp. USDA 10063]
MSGSAARSRIEMLWVATALLIGGAAGPELRVTDASPYAAKRARSSRRRAWPESFLCEGSGRW